MSDLAEALVAALADLTSVATNRTAEIPTKSGGKYTYNYADIADVIAVTRPVLAEHGIVALTPIVGTDRGLAVLVVLLHSSGDRLQFEFPFPPGQDAQSTGSAVTYHRRYALLAALGMAAGDDDDGAAAKKAAEDTRNRQAEQDARQNGPQYISPANAGRIRDACTEADVSVALVVAGATNGRTEDPAELFVSEIVAARDVLAELTSVSHRGEGSGSGSGTPAEPDPEPTLLDPSPSEPT